MLIVNLECQPGTFSFNGVEPCTECPIGTYSNANAAVACDICAESSTTLEVGSTECIGKTSCKLPMNQFRLNHSNCHLCIIKKHFMLISGPLRSACY